MKRILCALLSALLLLTLTACGGKDDAPETGGGNIDVESFSGGKGGASPVKSDSRQAAASLERVRDCLSYSDEITGAVAYLGQRERRDRSAMADWLSENCGDLISELPFLLDIPDDLILGAGTADDGNAV